MELKQQIVSVISEFRRSIIYLAAAIFCGSLLFYFISPLLLHGLQRHLGQKLAFFTVAEPFLAHVKLAFSVAVFSLMPWIAYCIWRALVKPFGLSGRNLFWFVLSTCGLFYAGAFFCYFVTLPLGVKFLLGYQSAELKAVITIGRFVSFVTIFVLAFGLIFELPVFMIFGAKAGLCSRRTYEQKRRYAVLIFSIAAAILTPTPDVVNMMLMGVPLYMLYELGIIILKVMKV